MGDPEIGSPPANGLPPAAGPPWLEVRVRPADPTMDSQRAAIAAALVRCGSSGVIEQGAVLVGYVPGDVDEMLVRAAIRQVNDGASVETTPVEPADWTERWREGIKAHRVGTVSIAPPWLASGLDPASTIIIDPGMAFGTGEHESTRGALRLLSGTVRRGDVAADLGAGSAVLAIAAVKLGAARVAAIEIDPDAIPNAEANIERNGVSDRVQVIEGDAASLLPLVAPVRLITANIISSVLIPLLDACARALTADGHAILAGLLEAEQQMMRDALERGGWRVDAEDVEGEWWSVLIHHAVGH